MENSFLKNIFGYFLIFVCGVFLGWFLFHSSETVVNKEAVVAEATNLWTCSLHPDVRKNEAGKCPICDLNLIPLDQYKKQNNQGIVRFSNDSEDLARLQTTVIAKQNPTKDIYIYGKVLADEMVVQKQTATISGRLDKMMINTTGERVTKGQTLALLYSPEFVSAQQELLEASQNKSSEPGTYTSARARLQKFGLTDAQITAIEKSDRVKINTEVTSSISGVVTARLVNDGEYIKKGSTIYEVADLSKVWVTFDAYEGDLPFLNKGDFITFTCKALPGSSFTGNIQYVYPEIDPNTHLSKVRVEFDNTNGKLKPEMHATGIVHANMAKYTDQLVVPVSAVLSSSSQPFVYVKQADGNETVFRSRSVTLGPKIGDSYIVKSGLSEGEEIILQGASNLSSSSKE